MSGGEFLFNGSRIPVVKMTRAIEMNDANDATSQMQYRELYT